MRPTGSQTLITLGGWLLFAAVLVGLVLFLSRMLGVWIAGGAGLLAVAVWLQLLPILREAVEAWRLEREHARWQKGEDVRQAADRAARAGLFRPD